MSAQKRSCEDCGEDVEAGERRTRCPKCGLLVCGWCWSHVHLPQAIKATTAQIPTAPKVVAGGNQ